MLFRSSLSPLSLLSLPSLSTIGREKDHDFLYGGTPKKAKVVVEDEEEVGLEDEEEATVTLSMEKDALECHIQSEVFMAS